MSDRQIIGYGESGSGKSFAILRYIEWRLEQALAAGQDMIARVYVGDGSKATYLDSGLVEMGLIEICDYPSYDWPMDVLNQISEGWFPEGGKEGARLVAPYKMVTVPGTKVQRKVLQQVNFERVGIWVYEGLGVMGEYMMHGYRVGGLSEQASRGIKIGPDAAVKITSQLYSLDQFGNAITTSPIEGSGSGTSYGTNGTAHYQMGQVHMNGVIQRIKALPGTVIMTSHERAARNKAGMLREGTMKDGVTYGGGELLIGPEVVGGAMTATVSKSVNETFHFQKVTKAGPVEVDEATGKKVAPVLIEHRMYTIDHMDAEGDTPIRFRALVRTGDPAGIKPFYTGSAPGMAMVDCYKDIAEGIRRSRTLNQEKLEAARRLATERAAAKAENPAVETAAPVPPPAQVPTAPAAPASVPVTPEPTVASVPAPRPITVARPMVLKR